MKGKNRWKKMHFWKLCFLLDILGLCVAAGCVLSGAGKGEEVRDSLRAVMKQQGDTKEQRDTGGPDDTVTEEVQKQTDELKMIAITFDDGPHPVYTEQLLDGLKERGVHATFFVTGEHAKAYPELIQRMQQEGHLIGNHTYTHIQLGRDNREKFKEELVETNQVIEEITGKEVQYVRPPYGTWDKAFEKELNMFPVLWTVDPLDWCSKDASCTVRKVVNQAEEGDIILLHDYYETSVTAALEIIDELQNEGYRFVTVDEILFD